MLKMNSKVFTEVYVFIYVFIKFFTPLQVNLFTCVCAPSGGPVPLLSRGSDGLLPDARLRLHLRRHHGRQPHLQAGNPEDLHGLRVAHWQGGGRAGGREASSCLKKIGWLDAFGRMGMNHCYNLCLYFLLFFINI